MLSLGWYMKTTHHSHYCCAPQFPSLVRRCGPCGASDDQCSVNLVLEKASFQRLELKKGNIWALFIPAFERALCPATSGGPWVFTGPSVLSVSPGVTLRCEAAHIPKEKEKSQKSEEIRGKKSASPVWYRGERKGSWTKEPPPRPGFLMNARLLSQQSARTRPVLNLVFLPFHGRQLGFARRPSPIVSQSE